jgi:hypothetical protein
VCPQFLLKLDACLGDGHLREPLDGHHHRPTMSARTNRVRVNWRSWHPQAPQRHSARPSKQHRALYLMTSTRTPSTLPCLLDCTMPFPTLPPRPLLLLPSLSLPSTHTNPTTELIPAWRHVGLGDEYVVSAPATTSPNEPRPITSSGRVSTRRAGSIASGCSACHPSIAALSDKFGQSSAAVIGSRVNGDAVAVLRTDGSEEGRPCTRE